MDIPAEGGVQAFQDFVPFAEPGKLFRRAAPKTLQAVVCVLQQAADPGGNMATFTAIAGTSCDSV